MQQIPIVALPPETYVTTTMLAQDTARLCSYLPSDIDIVVGAARSGMIPAAQIATGLHRPLWAADTLAGTLVNCGGGWRIYGTGESREIDPRRVLTVDDTAYWGYSTQRLRGLVAAKWPAAETLSASIYSHPQTLEYLDYTACILPGPHFLEWNLFNSAHADPSRPGKGCGSDLDGIFCPDFTPEEDDDGGRYLARMQTMPALQRPVRAAIPFIVTARLEKYRKPTVEWLRSRGIRYQNLIMGPWRTRAERDRGYPGNVIALKAQTLQGFDAHLFVESDRLQAEMIHRMTRRPVLCPSLGKAFL